MCRTCTGCAPKPVLLTPSGLTRQDKELTRQLAPGAPRRVLFLGCNASPFLSLWARVCSSTGMPSWNQGRELSKNHFGSSIYVLSDKGAGILITPKEKQSSILKRSWLDTPHKSRTKRRSPENVCTSRFWVLFQMGPSLEYNCWQNSFACSYRTADPSLWLAVNCKPPSFPCDMWLPRLFTSPKSVREKVSRANLLVRKVLHKY